MNTSILANTFINEMSKFKILNSELYTVIIVIC